jgi:phosphatidylglycerol---prolipoprotein diacylglyceryl transferase
MLAYPHIDPVAISIGPFKIHWYGLMYLAGFLIGWFLLKYRAKKFHFNWSNDQITDLVFYAAIGVVLGGRIGYMLFYNFADFIHHPWIIIKIWDGGMSFHGGMLGVILTVWLWARKQKIAFLDLTDLIAPIFPIGLAAGRIGNLINGFILGRVSNAPWAIVYPYGGPWPRHPIEIYEFLLEGVFLFILLWFYARKPRPRMAVSGMFLLGYGCVRCFCELFRQPDPQLGFIAFGWLTMGELLSLPMILLGIFLLRLAYKKGIYKKNAPVS